MSIQALNMGKVILAGAGPGDPDLITVKTLRYLRSADVIVTDRLVSQELLKENVKNGAVIFYAGKQGGKDDSTPQSLINELLVEHALQNKLVLRLKGGDVSFFSNVLDELSILCKHKIPFEIIPGITAASGASAYAGIPLTARGYAASVRFLTGHSPDGLNASGWSELAATDDTLVFYMSSGPLSVIVSRLLSHHISPEKELAIIEQATTPFQKVHVFNLFEFESKAVELKFASPSIAIIGKVVALHRQFGWRQNSSTTENYFVPVCDHLIKMNSSSYAS